MPIFDDFVRTEHAPRKPNESAYRFLNRSARPHFAEVRRLLSEWLLQFPAAAGNSVIRSMQSGDDHAFESAFWELYLHEAYRRSGYVITVHPAVPGSSKHPDFLIENHESRFYLEAVRANIASGTLAENRRLDDVHAVLENLKADKFKVNFTYDSVGPRPLATTALRNQLTRWLTSLDPEAVAAAYAAYPRHNALPRYAFETDGWCLEFTALPLRSEAFGRGGRLVGMFGPGRAVGADNVSPLTRAVDEKANRYGGLDAPLVIAVLANTSTPRGTIKFRKLYMGCRLYVLGKPPNAQAIFTRMGIG